MKLIETEFLYLVPYKLNEVCGVKIHVDRKESVLAKEFDFKPVYKQIQIYKSFVFNKISAVVYTYRSMTVFLLYFIILK